MVLEKNKIWTEESYQEYLDFLISLQEEAYRNFHQKLTFTQYEILGIRVPILRKIAKQIERTDFRSFLKFTGSHYYEEVLVEGLVIANILEEDFFKQELERFIPKIDNWAICDSFCNGLKIVSQNPKRYFAYFLDFLKQKEPFVIRVGLITILSFYIEEDYLDSIFGQLDQIQVDHYYVNMGMAWLLAEMYIKYPERTEAFFKMTKINDFVMNKTICKIRDSYRVSLEAKNYLLKYKRRKS